MDEGIGRIVAALDRRGLRDDTLVIFVSDNGGQESWQSSEQYKGRYADKPHTVLGDNRPLRGWKGDVYEGGIRVPALANWPGVLKLGICETPIHIVDWMPTLCPLAGCTPERDLDWDGTNVWPAIVGETQDRANWPLYWKAPRFSAIRSGSWKLIVKNDGTGAELYDVAADPYETKDLVAEEQQRVQTLKGQWQRFAAQDR